MPEDLAPGVFVEEVGSRSRSIEGVSTSTTGFVGPTRSGPIEGEPTLLTCFSDFERIYGGLDQLLFEDFGQRSHNYLAHAVRAYFEEGGRRLYVSRVYEGDDGRASAMLGTSGLQLRARHPGRAGNFTVQLLFRAGNNILRNPRGTLDTSTAPSPPPDPRDNQLTGARNHDVVLARVFGSPDQEVICRLEQFHDATVGRDSFRLQPAAAGSPASGVIELSEVDDVRVITVSVVIQPVGRFQDEWVWSDLAFSVLHGNESLGSLLAADPLRRSTESFVPLVLDIADGDPLDENGEVVAGALLNENNRLNNGSILQYLTDDTVGDDHRTLQVGLEGGSDGSLPDAGEYEGRERTERSGLKAFEDIEEISTVAAPGSTFRDFEALAPSDPIRRALINHCERMRYRLAVLDSQNGQSLAEIQQTRGSLDSTRAALYYPWVRIFDPVTEQEILQPPSGYVTGIYARNDIERGVHKPPANEVVRSAIGLEFLLDRAEQQVLNPLGINCLRFFQGRGYRVWGGRTISSDPEWKYVNVRRYIAFLERSIERGTQWAVFESNAPALWENVRQTIQDFLFNEWRQNHLLGSKPEQAYFVRCDRTTITQSDLDNGRLICLIGVAVLKPAEFMILRIGQKTADSSGPLR
jgi:phage tail sheath protein FI